MQSSSRLKMGYFSRVFTSGNDPIHKRRGKIFSSLNSQFLPRRTGCCALCVNSSRLVLAKREFEADGEILIGVLIVTSGVKPID